MVTTPLVVADPADAGAAAVARAAAARSRALTFVLPVQLSLARWEHRVDGSGRAATTIELPDGRRLVDHELGTVLCRAYSFPTPRFVRSTTADSEYAAAELQALVVSWLRGLGDRVVNGVDGVSAVGPSWGPRRALVEAHRAGLPVAGDVVATSGRLLPGWTGSPYAARLPAERDRGPAAGEVLVAGGQALGRLAERFGAACLQLAARARCRLLEVGFCAAGDDVAVSWVSPVPALAHPWQAEVVAELLAGASAPRRLPVGSAP